MASHQSWSAEIAAAAAMLATRPTKGDVDLNTLREQWADEAASLGFGADSIDELLNVRALDPEASLTVDVPDEHGQLIERDVRSDEFAALIAERMIEVDSTCTRHQITALVAQLHGRASVRVVEEVTSWLLAQPQLVPVPVRGANGLGAAVGIATSPAVGRRGPCRAQRPDRDRSTAR